MAMRFAGVGGATGGGVGAFSGGVSAANGASPSPANPGFPMDPHTRHARKLYVGNLPTIAGLNELMISQFFNETMETLMASKAPGPVVCGCYLNMQRKFAFIECRSMEEATFIINLDGIQFCGSSLKLRRPQDYNANLASQQLQQELQARGIAIPASLLQSLPGANLALPAAPEPEPEPPVVEEDDEKIFVGGLPHHMTEEEANEMLSCFGPLKFLQLVMEADNSTSRGFAFSEWESSADADLACETLNKMVFGGRVLSVRRANLQALTRSGGSAPPPSALQPASPESVKASSILGTAGFTGAASVEELLSGSLMRWDAITERLEDRKENRFERWSTLTDERLTVTFGKASRVIGIRNAVPLHPVPAVAELQRLVLEAKRVCEENIGAVRSAIFHHTGGGQILVEFPTPLHALQALKFLHQKLFEGRVIACVFADPTREMMQASLARLVEDSDKTCEMGLKEREEKWRQESEDESRRGLRFESLAPLRHAELLPLKPGAVPPEVKDEDKDDEQTERKRKRKSNWDDTGPIPGLAVA